DAVHGDVYVTAAIAINGKNRVSILRGVIGICGFYAGSKVREVRNVAADQRKILHFLRGDVLANIGFERIEQRSFSVDLNYLSCRAYAEREILRSCRPDEGLDSLGASLVKTGHAHRQVVKSNRQRIEPVAAV